VIATAKSDDERRVRQLGAAETVDYTRVDVATAIDELCPEGVPLMFDIVNDKSQLLALSRVVQDGGRVASARFAADRRALFERGISSFNVIANGCGAEVLVPALELAQAGALRILVSDVTPLEGLPVVLPEFQRGGRGKVVVDIGS
jgi:NADPH:quinone reductase-like Zn-dependent oxidoreductase